ncbi:MAG: Maf family nucleotide pyrophosphatase [Flavobacteriales bacterium]
MKITNYNIILGSNSARRQELLSEMGFQFKVKVSNKEEIYPNKLKGKEVSEFLAIQKSDNLKENLQKNELLITADTIVIIDNKILGKPKSKEESCEMIQSLSGKKHEVITSVALTSNYKQEVFSVLTKVTFNTISEKEINFYITKHSPFDKAGSYGIQEWIGLIAIHKIEGSYTNVVGLPTSELYNKIRNF